MLFTCHPLRQFDVEVLRILRPLLRMQFCRPDGAKSLDKLRAWTTDEGVTFTFGFWLPLCLTSIFLKWQFSKVMTISSNIAFVLSLILAGGDGNDPSSCSCNPFRNRVQPAPVCKVLVYLSPRRRS